MTGYVRNDIANNIQPNASAQAEDVDGEFDAIVAAFHNTTGHTHDGTAAEGAPITVVGPSQNVEVTATEVEPSSNDTIDLGTSTNKFKDAYLSGNITVEGNVDGRDISVDGAALDQAETDIGSLETRMTTAESDITSIESAASALTDRVDDAEADITALETLTSTHTSDIASNASDIADNASDIASLESSVNAMVQTVISALYPVGSLYMSSNSTMPSAMTTGRTWVAYAEGRAIVGVGTADGVTYTGGSTRGSNEVTLTTAQLPSHTHGDGTLSAASHNHSSGSLSGSSGGATFYQDDADTGTGASVWKWNGGGPLSISISGSTGNSGTLSVSGNTSATGSGDAHTNIQPSIGVYVWRRTA